jgi:hypothetical protein
VENVIDHVCYECAVMADQQYGFLSVTQVFLEPSRRLEIEVVRRLVEKEDISGAHKLSGEAQTTSFSATQLVNRLRTRLFRIKGQALENRVDFGGKRVAAFSLESLEIAIVSREHLRRDVFSDSRHFVGLCGERVLECQELSEFPRGSFPHRRRTRKVAMLFEKSDAQAGMLRHDSFGGLLHSCDQAKECRLTAAVSSDYRPPITFSDRERDPFEDS